MPLRDLNCNTLHLSNQIAVIFSIIIIIMPICVIDRAVISS